MTTVHLEDEDGVARSYVSAIAYKSKEGEHIVGLILKTEHAEMRVHLTPEQAEEVAEHLRAEAASARYFAEAGA